LISAAEMALEAVNANDTVLRDYNLKMKVNNGECKAEAVMNTFIYYVLFSVYKKLVGILGEKRISNNIWNQYVTHNINYPFFFFSLLIFFT
jgi:hypothetical protein